MRVLVTGGSGFIGKNMVEKLLPKYKIFAPSHSELDLLNEKTVRDFLETRQIDVIVHSATKPGHRNVKDPSNLVYANTRMFFNLARNSKLYHKLIFLSSGAVYDERHYQPKMKEDYFDNHVPIDENGYLKYLTAKYIEKMDNAVELRIFGIFGKYEDYAIRFISNAICKTLFDLPITIKQNRRFDYLYIDDLEQVLDYFIKNSGRYCAYNVSPDKSIELYTLAKKVRDISGKELPIVVGKPGLGLEYSGDNSRLKKEMPSIAFTDVDRAIRQLYAWYKKNIHLVNKEFLLVDK